MNELELLDFFKILKRTKGYSLLIRCLKFAVNIFTSVVRPTKMLFPSDKTYHLRSVVNFCHRLCKVIFKISDHC